MSSRRVLVTGASSGIGAATAIVLARIGWHVVATARRLDRLETLAAEHARIEPIELDVTDDNSVAGLALYLKQTGGLDAVVHSAGGAFGLDTVAAGKVEDWQHMYNINVLGTLRVTQALLPLLVASAVSEGGSTAQHPTKVSDIVIITSTAAHAPYKGGAGYVGAKHAERILGTTLRMELAGQPIRVIQIEPGAVATEEFSLNRFDGDQAKADAVYAGYDPLVADDVAEAIAWTLSRPPHVNIDHLMLRPIAQVSNTETARDSV
jgi:NADP-dependent 3-hydroxy acid dehydrogenase YdfG